MTTTKSKVTLRVNLVVVPGHNVGNIVTIRNNRNEEAKQSGPVVVELAYKQQESKKLSLLGFQSLVAKVKGLCDMKNVTDLEFPVNVLEREGFKSDNVLGILVGLLPGVTIKTLD